MSKGAPPPGFGWGEWPVGEHIPLYHKSFKLTTPFPLSKSCWNSNKTQEITDFRKEEAEEKFLLLLKVLAEFFF